MNVSANNHRFLSLNNEVKTESLYLRLAGIRDNIEIIRLFYFVLSLI
jgi:hypothetical protein